MAKNICGATCSDDYDFVLTDDGHLSVETETAKSVANILKLDFNSNDDWSLDYDLGIHWLTKDNDGLLQTKNNEAQIVNAIQRKLLQTEGVNTIEKIEVARGINRKLYFKVVVVTTTGEKIVLEKGV